MSEKREDLLSRIKYRAEFWASGESDDDAVSIGLDLLNIIEEDEANKVKALLKNIEEFKPWDFSNVEKEEER